MNHLKTLLSVGACIICLACVQAFYVPFEAYEIAQGVGTGVSALPYYAKSKTSLKSMDAAMEGSGAAVTLADTYRAAYGKKLSQAPENGDTGQAFSDLKTASAYLQSILKAKGVPDYKNYLLTRADFSNSPDFSLVAAVHRTRRTVKIKDKTDPNRILTLIPSQAPYYVPYRTDAYGKPLDTIYEWAGVPDDCFARQGHQAIMLTLTANKILKKKPLPDYWAAETQWQAGNYQAIVIKQDRMVCNALNIKKGYSTMPGFFDRTTKK